MAGSIILTAADSAGDEGSRGSTKAAEGCRNGASAVLVAAEREA